MRLFYLEGLRQSQKTVLFSCVVVVLLCELLSSAGETWLLCEEAEE